MRPCIATIAAGLASLMALGLAACAAGGREATDANVACERTDIGIAFISEGERPDRDKVEASARQLTAILASDAFARRCEASTMNRTDGRTEREVCAHLACAGRQIVRVALYRDEDMGTIAFEKKGAVFVNAAKARAGTVGNLAHEFAHVLGYSHRSFWGFRRERSVPYVVGKLVEAAHPEPTP